MRAHMRQHWTTLQPAAQRLEEDLPQHPRDFGHHQAAHAADDAYTRNLEARRKARWCGTRSVTP